MESEREGICSQLNELENWLYEDGEDCDRDTYINKLKALHNQTNCIKERASDFELCPGAFDELKRAINNARAAVNEFKKGSPKYDHLTEIEFINMSEHADKAQKWLDINMTKFTQSPRTVDSPVKVAEIRQELQSLNASIYAVINRPKPKPASKPPQSKDTSGGAEHQNGENAARPDADKSAHSNNIPEDSTMDVE